MAYKLSIELVDKVIDEVASPFGVGTGTVTLRALASVSRIFRDRVQRRLLAKVDIQRSSALANLTSIISTNPALSYYITSLRVGAIKSWYLRELHCFPYVRKLIVQDLAWKVGEEDAAELNGRTLPQITDLVWIDCDLEIGAFKRIVSSFRKLKNLTLKSTVLYTDADETEAPDTAYRSSSSSEAEGRQGLSELEVLRLGFDACSHGDSQTMQRSLTLISQLHAEVTTLDIRVGTAEYTDEETKAVQAAINHFGSARLKDMTLVGIDTTALDLHQFNDLRSLKSRENWVTRPLPEHADQTRAFVKLLSTLRSREVADIVWEIECANVPGSLLLNAPKWCQALQRVQSEGRLTGLKAVVHWDGQKGRNGSDERLQHLLGLQAIKYGVENLHFGRVPSFGFGSMPGTDL